MDGSRVAADVKGLGLRAAHRPLLSLFKRRPLTPVAEACANDHALMAEHEQLRRLKYFLSPHVFAMILNSSEDQLLAFHQREIAVVFCDLRGFTAFARTAPSTVIVDVLGAYHGTIGPIIVGFNGILERFTGDGVMVYFDDGSLGDQAVRAVRMAVRMRDDVGHLSTAWRRRGHALDVGIGIALGEATLGPIGFDQRRDYAAIGWVTNLASRLCAEAAAGQVLITEQLYAWVRDLADAEPLGAKRMKGFEGPVDVYSVRALRAQPFDNERALEHVPAKR